MKRTLIYGYGNPGRQDDGLGIALVERLKDRHADDPLSFVAFDSNYQLNIEDALTISEYDLILFADASVEDISTYTVSHVEASAKTEFTMHAMSPEFVLHLCQHLFGKFPEAYLLHIKGYEFELQEGLTQRAEANLNAAVDFAEAALIELRHAGGFVKRADILFNQRKNNQ